MLHRAEEVSAKQWTFLKSLFIPLVIFMIICTIYLYNGQENDKKPYVIYPSYKKKPINLVACGLQVQEDPVVKANNLQAYLVGSYIEHRREVKMVKTIAVVLREEKSEYRCLLCCDGQTMSAPASLDIHSDHFGFEYGTADINCHITEKCTTPTHVAIMSTSTEEDESLKNDYTFQPVRNLKEMEIFHYEFTVCISVMYEYDNILQFVQAMEMFKILGVQRVAIYLTNCTSEMQQVLDYYVKLDFVELIHWKIASYITVSRGWQKSTSSGQLHYFGQLATLNDCLYRYMYQSRYIALQDLDELILPLNFRNWNELLPEVEKVYNQIGVYEFENNMFPVSLKDFDPMYSPDFWKEVKGVNILQHIIRMSNDPTRFNNFKIIVNPRLVYKTTVHGVLQSERGTVRVSPQIARLYHVKEIEEEILEQFSKIDDPHLRDYADSLIPAVSKVLEEALGIS